MHRVHILAPTSASSSSSSTSESSYYNPYLSHTPSNVLESTDLVSRSQTPTSSTPNTNKLLKLRRGSNKYPIYVQVGCNGSVRGSRIAGHAYILEQVGPVQVHVRIRILTISPTIRRKIQRNTLTGTAHDRIPNLNNASLNLNINNLNNPILPILPILNLNLNTINTINILANININNTPNVNPLRDTTQTRITRPRRLWLGMNNTSYRVGIRRDVLPPARRMEGGIPPLLDAKLRLPFVARDTALVRPAQGINVVYEESGLSSNLNKYIRLSEHLTSKPLRLDAFRGHLEKLEAYQVKFTTLFMRIKASSEKMHLMQLRDAYERARRRMKEQVEQERARRCEAERRYYMFKASQYEMLRRRMQRAER
ncbi:hypothetical protein ONZ45_g12664 [Pleurotus djamor]|nr:hypothetical protein ONZ45_g12664 [Pleurotus djamor]